MLNKKPHDGGDDASSVPFAEVTATEVPEGDLLMLDDTTRAPDSSSIPSPQRVVIDDMDAVPNLPTDEEQHLQSLKTGAGVASGAVGLLLGGPILALIFGFGAAYAADQQGAAGDSARAVGELALIATAKAQEIDQEHHVVDKIKHWAGEAWEKAQELDRQNHILERTKDALVDFVRRHNLIERGVEGVGKATFWVANKIANKVTDYRAVPTAEASAGSSSVRTNTSNKH